MTWRRRPPPNRGDAGSTTTEARNVPIPPSGPPRRPASRVTGPVVSDPACGKPADTSQAKAEIPPELPHPESSAMISCYYELRLVGALPPEVLVDFEGLRAAPEPATTVVQGELDQAALNGLLARLELLGVQVREVRRRHDAPVPGSVVNSSVVNNR